MQNLERLLSPRQVAELEGCSVTSVYQRLLAGEYQALRDGKKTLISSESVARRRENLPKATFGARLGIRGIPPKEAPAP